MSHKSEFGSIDTDSGSEKRSHAHGHLGAGVPRSPTPPPQTHVTERTVRDSDFEVESVRGSIPEHRRIVQPPPTAELRAGQSLNEAGGLR